MEIPEMGEVKTPVHTEIDRTNEDEGKIGFVEFDENERTEVNLDPLHSFDSLKKEFYSLFPELEQTFAGSFVWTDSNGNSHEFHEKCAREDFELLKSQARTIMARSNCKFLECWWMGDEEDVQSVSLLLPSLGGNVSTLIQKVKDLFAEETETCWQGISFVDADENVFRIEEDTDYQTIFDQAVAIIARYASGTQPHA